MYASWPPTGEVDEILIRSSDFLMTTVHELRLRLKSRMSQAKSKVYNYLILFNVVSQIWL